jgi:hypothetical protein
MPPAAGTSSISAITANTRRVVALAVAVDSHGSLDSGVLGRLRRPGDCAPGPAHRVFIVEAPSRPRCPDYQQRPGADQVAVIFFDASPMSRQ